MSTGMEDIVRAAVADLKARGVHVVRVEACRRLSGALCYQLGELQPGDPLWDTPLHYTCNSRSHEPCACTEAGPVLVIETRLPVVAKEAGRREVAMQVTLDVDKLRPMVDRAIGELRQRIEAELGDALAMLRRAGPGVRVVTEWPQSLVEELRQVAEAGPVLRDPRSEFPRGCTVEDSEGNRGTVVDLRHSAVGWLVKVETKDGVWPMSPDRIRRVQEELQPQSAEPLTHDPLNPDDVQRWAGVYRAARFEDPLRQAMQLLADVQPSELQRQWLAEARAALGEAPPFPRDIEHTRPGGEG